jgi:hypothetical protein
MLRIPRQPFVRACAFDKDAGGDLLIVSPSKQGISGWYSALLRVCIIEMGGGLSFLGSPFERASLSLFWGHDDPIRGPSRHEQKQSNDGRSPILPGRVCTVIIQCITLVTLPFPSSSARQRGGGKGNRQRLQIVSLLLSISAVPIHTYPRLWKQSRKAETEQTGASLSVSQPRMTAGSGQAREASGFRTCNLLSHSPAV